MYNENTIHIFYYEFADVVHFHCIFLKMSQIVLETAKYCLFALQKLKNWEIIDTIKQWL